jgi:hypothetical protein
MQRNILGGAVLSRLYQLKLQLTTRQGLLAKKTFITRLPEKVKASELSLYMILESALQYQL